MKIKYTTFCFKETIRKGGKKEAKSFSFWLSDLLDFLKVRAISSTSGPKAKGIVSSTKEVF